MTTASALLVELRGLGIELQPHGDALRFRPRDRVTPDLQARLRDCKGELLAMLRTVNGVYVYETPGNSSETPVVSPAVPQDAHGDAVAAPRPRSAVPVEWPGAAADFCLLLTADDLPPVPFRLNPWTEVLDAGKMLRWLRADILRGPSGPRAFYGALQRELQDLQRFALQAAENEPQDRPRMNADGAT